VRRSRQRDGLTIVEMVVVIALISIVGAVSFSRWFDSIPYEKRLVTEAILSTLRGAQLISLSRSSIKVRVVSTSSGVRLSTLEGGIQISTRDVSTASVVTMGSAGLGITCAATLTPTDISFDAEGEIESIDPDGMAICVGGETAICVSPSGFAYQGVCM